jgi:sugar (pentulose or hexulose) kinase
VTAGVYRDVEEATSHIALQRDVQRPDAKRSERYARLHDLYKKLYPATAAAMHGLSALGRE